MGQSRPNCPFTQKGYIWGNFIQYFWYSIMSHHHADFKKNSYSGFLEQSKQVFWAQIGVKMTHFGTRGVFFKNWAALLFLKHNGVMQSMQSFKKILMD